MLLRAANRAAQSPALLVEETLSGDIGRTQLIVNVESFGLVENRDLVISPILTFLKSNDPLVVEAAIQALRLLYIQDSKPFSASVRSVLIDVLVLSMSPAVRLVTAMCLADLTFSES